MRLSFDAFSRSRGAGLAALAIAGALLFVARPAASEPPETATPRSLEEVEGAFSARRSELDAAYREGWLAAQDQRIRGLQRLIDRAAERKDIDAALHYRDKLVAAQQEKRAVVNDERPAAGEVASLETQLRDATWEWGDRDEITFRRDGKVGNGGWTSRGLTTTWKAIDGRTVLLYIESGRADNRVAVLMFNPGLEHFTPITFEGVHDPAVKHRRVKRR